VGQADTIRSRSSADRSVSKKKPTGQAMTDTPPPKRSFWQIHLSTAVALTFFAAFLLAGNLLLGIWTDRVEFSGRMGGFVNGWGAVRGFPFPIEHIFDDDSHELIYSRIAVNAVCSLVFLIIAWRLLERRIDLCGENTKP
jgi:hypothetical protein